MDVGGDTSLSVNVNNEAQSTPLNISDVFDAISIADPTFDVAVGIENNMPRNTVAPLTGPYVRIVEQPASKALRFRYECEGRSAGSIPGANSTNEKKTYPTIEVCGYTGPAVVVVSCVNKDEPYKPHPHNLVGREKCSRGVCTVKTEFTPENSLVTFSNLGIQCVKRRDIADALNVRQELRVDPFKTGFAHREQPQGIDLNAVRLCFQVFLQEEQTGRVRHTLRPIVSDVIYDKKAICDLQIMKLSCCAGSFRGGTEVVLLCERVAREDIAVVFYQKENDQVVWEAEGTVTLVHKQVAIAFTTPAYNNPRNTSDHVETYLQLRRVSDNARSNAVPFTYTRDYSEDYINGKRRKTPILSKYEQESKLAFDVIKSEPRDRTPPHATAMSPPLRGYDHQNPYNQVFQWNPQGAMNIGGPSLAQTTYQQDMSWPGPSYQVLSPVQSVSPGMQMSPHGMHVMSPMGMGMSPGMGVSPSPQLSPGHMHGGMSPMGQGAMSPMGQPMGNISPIHMQQQHQQVLGVQPAAMGMELSGPSEPPSLTNLLQQEGFQQLHPLSSGDLAGLSSLLNERPDLTDSLNRLSTADLLQ